MAKEVGRAWATLKLVDGTTEITHKVTGTEDKHAFYIMLEKMNNSDHFILQNTITFKYINKALVKSFVINIEKYNYNFEV